MPKPWLACLAAVCAADAAAATRLHLDLVAYEARNVELELRADGKPLCTLRGAEASGLSCDAQLPAKTATWSVHGRYTLPGMLGLGRRVEGEGRVAVLDVGPVVQPLDTGNAPYGERMAVFVEGLQRFRREHVADADVALAEKGPPARAAQIEAAQKRLGYALPADFVSLQARLGHLQMGDNSVSDIADIDDAYTQMRKVWGTPEEAMQGDYSEAFRGMLKKSTILFTEAGDGYGGLIYRPGPTKACGEGGTYYWTEQEGGTDVLKRADGRCMGYAEAMRWVVNYAVIDPLAEEVGEKTAPTVLIDSALAAQTVDLILDTDSGRFGAQWRARWPGPHQ